MKRRNLRPEERELWNQVAKTAVPMHPARKAPEPLSQPSESEKPVREAVHKFQVGSKAKPATSLPSSATAAPKMDAKAFKKLNRGKIAPEAKIDLHGMTLDQAHPELINFILRSHGKGRRLVLVITGKGGGPGPAGPMPYQRGILRRQVPTWLTQNPVAPLILQTLPASPRHGGEGALYVYLRRRR